jgi:transposase InsO family protein
MEDSPMGPKHPHSTSLSAVEEAACIMFRKSTLLPLDDCLYALQDSIPHLTRSSLHRLFQRHGISQLPKTTEEVMPKKKFQTYPIGYFHIDITEVHTEEGKLHLYVAIDRTSKFAYAELHEKATRATACAFLRHVIAAVPYAIHTILTDNGIQFTHFKNHVYAWEHACDRVCRAHGIAHKCTPINHPWTNGQVERMNRTLQEATVKRYDYESHASLKQHLHDFLQAYNFGKRLKALRDFTPYGHILKCWEKSAHIFKIDPQHFTVGLNT